MERKVSIIGIGAIKVGAYPETLEHELLIPALKMAVEDAGISKDDIGGMIFSHPRPYCKQRYFSTYIAGYLRHPLSALMEVTGNGMTGGLAFRCAVQEVSSGRVDICVALGVSRESLVSTSQHMHEVSSKAVGDVDFHTPFGINPITWMAMTAQRYMYEYKATSEQFAAVAVKNRRNAAKNPIAHFTEPITIQDVLNSRIIADPLHILDCPPRDDGAVAIILAPSDLAKRMKKVPVHARGFGFYHEGIHMIDESPGNLLEFPALKRAAAEAYRSADVSSGDIDVAEIYAPTTVMEIIISEGLGFFKAGEGARAVVEGQTEIEGKIPICTAGGCQSRGHPPMVTPLLGIFEVCQQLRGEGGARQVKNAKLGLTTCELGHLNGMLIEILERGE